MVQPSELKQYFDGLPSSMTLKKKVIKAIVKRAEPLSQAELKNLLNLKDWTNLRRVLKEIVDEGLVNKKRIGSVDYYVCLGAKASVEMLELGDSFWWVDKFEPDFKGDEPYVRIKQTLRTGKDQYEVRGKISIPLSRVKELIKALSKIK